MNTGIPTPLTPQGFQQRFREFRETAPDLIANVIAEAQRSVAPCVWGWLTNDGVGYLAAHLLATDPAGTSTALMKDPDPELGSYGRSSYGVRFLELRTQVTAGAYGAF